MAPRTRPRNPIVRLALLVLGVLVIVAAPIIGAIPGPGGLFVFAAGLVLVLQNSKWARRNFARWKRRWPRFGHYADMALRRRSFRRRQSQMSVDERRNQKYSVTGDAHKARRYVWRTLGIDKLLGKPR